MNWLVFLYFLLNYTVSFLLDVEIVEMRVYAEY